MRQVKAETADAKLLKIGHRLLEFPLFQERSEWMYTCGSRHRWRREGA